MAVETGAGGPGRHLTLTRLIAAPRGVVWKAWTDPVQLAQWWGPKGFTNPRCEIELKPQGAIHIDMRGPDGTIYPMGGMVREFVALERLVFTGAALDETGKALFETLNTLTLADQPGGTLLRLEAQVLAIHSAIATEYLKGQEQGWSESLDRLAALLKQPLAAHATFTIERTLAASPARVFAAWATREAKARWFGGGAEWTEIAREFDFRVGGRETLSGAWRGGTVSHFNCRYHDIVPNERIVYAYDMRLDERMISVSLATVEFQPAGAGTRLIVTEQGAYLDGYDDGGSRESGTGSILDRLEAALA
jgi:uncharacterized protein YndB with AHSA1/START domain